MYCAVLPKGFFWYKSENVKRPECKLILYITIVIYYIIYYLSTFVTVCTVSM